MTRNKKKLRRAERRSQFNRAAQTFVLTGLLLAGGAGVAGAATVDWTQSAVTINAAMDKISSTPSITEDSEAGYAKNIDTTKLSITDGGKLELEGARLLHYVYKSDASKDIPGMDVEMTGGELTLTGSSSFSSIDANTFALSGGTVSLTGKIGASWENASYIGAYKGMDITGGKITLNTNSELFAGDHLKITGGEITMLGTSTGNDYDGDAAHIMFTGTDNGNLIGGDAKITVGDASASNYGVMTTGPKLNMTGGEITVQEKAHLLLQPDTGPRAGNGQSSSIKYTGTDSGDFNLSDGAIKVNAGGTVDAEQINFAMSGGSVGIGGASGKQGLMKTGDFTMTGGTLTVDGGGQYSALLGLGWDGQSGADKNKTVTLGGGEVAVAGGGGISSGYVVIDGATVSVAGGGTGVDSQWRAGSQIGGMEKLTMTGGAVTLGDYAMLYGGVPAVAGNNGVSVQLSGGTVDLAGADTGKAAILRAHANSDEAATGTSHSKMIIDGATVNVGTGKFGVLASRDTTLSKGGVLDVQGDLRVVGALAGSNDSGKSLSDGISSATKGGTFTLADGGRLTVGGSGKLDFVTGEVALDLNGGTLETSTLTIADSASTGITAKDVSVSSGAYQLDTLTQSAGALKVAGGSLTVNTLAQTGGSITVGGSSAGTLAVSSVLKNITYAAGTDGIKIDNLGVLEAGYDVLLQDNNTLQTDVGKLQIENGGTLRVTGKEGTKIALTDASAIKSALFAGGGLLEIVGATITTTSDTVNVTDSKGMVISDATLSDTASAITASSLTTGVKDITVSDTVTGPLTIKSDDLRLIGAAEGGQLVTAKDAGGALVATNIEVQDGKAVTLGSASNAAHATQGTLNGGISLGASSGSGTLNAANGDFTLTGDITTKTGDSGVVNVTGATLSAGKIGNSSNAIGAVNVDSGSTLAASNAVYIKDAAITGGSLQTTGKDVAGDITLSGQVTVTSGGIIQASNNVKITDAIGVTNGIVRANNDIDLTSATITTTDGAAFVAKGDISATGKSFTAGENGLALSAENGKITVDAINGAAGTTHVAAKTLTAGSQVTLGQGSTLVTSGSGADASTISQTLTMTGAQAKVAELTVSKAATLDSTTMIAEKLTLSEGGAVKNGSTLVADTLTLDSAQSLYVGTENDTAGGATLIAGNVDLAGGALYLDLAWGQAATQVAVGNFTDTATGNDAYINGDVGVGMNSMLTMGTTDTSWLATQVAQMGGLSKNGINAALGIYAPQTLASSKSLLVDGTKTSTDFSTTPPAANTAVFSGQSLMVVNGAAATDGNVALRADAAAVAKISDGAKLRIVNPKVGKTYTVLGDKFTTEYYKADGTTKITDGTETGWTGVNLSTDSRMISLQRNKDGSFGAKLISATSIFPGMSGEMGGLVDSLYRDGRNDVNSKKAGVRFLSRATSEDYLSDADRVAPTLEGAAQMAVVGAAPGMTLAAAEAAANAVSTRTSFASPLLDTTKAAALHMDADGVSADAGLSAGDGLRNGLGLWIMPLYQSSNVWGMKAEEFKTGYHGDLGGVALGADYTFQDMFRVGVALNLGGGYAESSGDFNKTTNSFNFWGVNLYGGWTRNNFGITADLGYTGNYNKLKQETPDSMRMGDLKGDVTSTALTAGLRGEYKVETSVLDLIPHVGVRYTDLTVDSYDVKRDGTVFDVDRSQQSIWTFPVGITASKTIETGNGWQFKPQVDFTVIPAAGDVKAKSKVRVPGVDASAELKTQVVDYMTYQGGVGFDVQKDNVSFGLNYTIQASEHRTGHGVFGTLRYEF